MAFLRGNRKGQGSFEFIGIVAVLMLIVLSSIGLIQGKALTVLKERNDLYVESVGHLVESEVTLALDVNGDYYRQFDLPYFIEGANYTLETPGPTDVVITLADSKQVVFLASNVTGSFQKGTNTLRKQDGVIYVNT